MVVRLPVRSVVRRTAGASPVCHPADIKGSRPRTGPVRIATRPHEDLRAILNLTLWGRRTLDPLLMLATVARPSTIVLLRPGTRRHRAHLMTIKVLTGKHDSIRT